MSKKTAAQIAAARADAAADEEEQEAVEARERADALEREAEDEAEDGGDPVGTVPMRRLPDFAGPGPDTADIHPDEVENMKLHGWVTVED